MMRKRSRVYGFLPFPFWKYYNMRPSRLVVESLYDIKKEYSTLDFVPIENQINTSYQETTMTQKTYFFLSFKKWGTLFFIGFSIGFLGAMQTSIIQEIFVFKHNFLSRLLKWNPASAYFFWAAVTLLPLLFIALILVYLEPSARGCGIPESIAYLNGINVPRFSNWRVAAIKYVIAILSTAANLPGGREESFIHFGALFGASLARLRIPFTKYKPFSMYSDPNGRRDLVTAGTAAAVAVVFGAPIGGILFCLEEGVTFWNPDLTFLMFVCTVVATFTKHVIRTGLNAAEGLYSNYAGYVFFKDVDIMDLTYHVSEVPIFILFGIIGAVLGILWNYMYLALYRLRKRYINTNIFRLIEAICFGILFFVICIGAFQLFSDKCTKEYRSYDRLSRSKSLHHFCKEGEFESIGLFFFQEMRYIMMSLFLIKDTGIFHYSLLIFAVFYYLFMSVIQNGTYLPSGVLIPHLGAGSAWGHLLSRWLLGTSEDKYEERMKYTFLGAVAQASGCARLTLSLGIIMVETCGQTNFALPVFIVVLSAKWFGGLFSEPIFRIMASLEGYPLIRATLIPASGNVTASSVMSTPVVTLPMEINTWRMVEVLTTNSHSHYPIHQNGKVVGIISKRQMFALLKTKTFKPPENNEEMMKQYTLLTDLRGESFTKLKKALEEGEFEIENKTINFKVYMNPCPYMVFESTSLKRLYSFFLALGPAYVLVVNEKGNVTGIVTRKDIARYKRLAQLFTIRTEISTIV